VHANGLLLRKETTLRQLQMQSFVFFLNFDDFSSKMLLKISK